MARNRIASGLTISDISKMTMGEFESYTPSQQREIVSRLASTANKRFSKLEQRGITTPATIRLSQSGGKVSVKGKEGTDLKLEMLRAKNFLKSDTSSISGYKKLQKEIALEEGRYNSHEGDSKTIGLAFSYYDLLYDRDPSISKIRDKYKIVEYIADEIAEGKTTDDILQNTMSWLENRYIENQREYNNNNISFANAIENDIPNRYRR